MLSNPPTPLASATPGTVPVLKIVVQASDLYATQQSFDYQLNSDQSESLAENPESLRRLVGKRVLVPFGKKRLSGLVVDTGWAEAPDKLKAILEILDEPPMVHEEWLEFLKAMARHCCIELAPAVLAALPPQSRFQSQRRVFLTEFGRSTIVIDPIEETWVTELKKRNGQSMAALLKKLPVTPGVVKSLLARGMIEERVKEKFMVESWPKRERRKAKRDTHESDLPQLTTAPILSADQAQVLESMLPQIGSGRSQSFLLHGVTGSGKTEVYLQLIAAAQARSLSSVVLVPEIALTPQLIQRLRGRFGTKVAVLHSHLRPAERLDQWLTIARGERNIVVGARSALFAPVKNLGLLILDEEHDHSYKQDERLPYHGRELAKIRAEMNQALLVLGSATPDVATYYENEDARILRMPNRIAGMHKPDVRIIDMRTEPRSYGQPAILSQPLRQALQRTLAAKQGAILFLNRRGFTPVLLCSQCGATPQCEQCCVTLTYHLKERQLVCHYCGSTHKREIHCVSCGAAAWIDLGAGTERLAHELQTIFPESHIARMDRDTTRAASSFSEIISAMDSGKTDILVGTQMVTKGLDIERVTLIGVISADLSLWLPDFRACERTFQLVTQVAGRSGRGKLPGEVYIQTFNPHHYAIQAACGENYLSFYQQEIAIRRAANYPPFCDLTLLHFSGTDAKAVATGLQDGLVEAALYEIAKELKAEKIGPITSPLAKLKGKFRWQVLFKHAKIVDRNLQASLKVKFSALKRQLQKQQIHVSWDLSPLNFM